MSEQHPVKFSRREFVRRSGAGLLGLGLTGAALPAACDTESGGEAFGITHGPVVQSPGPGEVTVTWHTNRNGVSNVLYGTDGQLDHVAVTSRDGLIPNDSTCHAVRLTGLVPGKAFQYQLISREFKKYVSPYVVKFGEIVESETFTCTPLDPVKESFSFLMWNDIHDDSRRLEAMFEDVAWEGVDFVVLNGDILNDFISQEQFFSAFYDACSRRFGSSLPMVYVRGNHETRGPWARRLSDFVPGRDGRPYYAFNHGNVHVVALDSGEDKPDDNKEYAGLVEFASFRDEQTRWLQADLESEAAQRARFRIILSHQPMAPVGTECFGAQEVRRLWRGPVNAAGAQLWLSGHTHDFAWCKPGEDGDNVFHAMTNPPDATVRVDVMSERLTVTVIKKGGTVLHQETIPA